MLRSRTLDLCRREDHPQTAQTAFRAVRRLIGSGGGVTRERRVDDGDGSGASTWFGPPARPPGKESESRGSHSAAVGLDSEPARRLPLSRDRPDWGGGCGVLRAVVGGWSRLEPSPPPAARGAPRLDAGGHGTSAEPFNFRAQAPKPPEAGCRPKAGGCGGRGGCEPGKSKAPSPARRLQLSPLDRSLFRI